MDVNIDALTVAALGHVAKGSLDKLLGPTAEYLGHGLKGMVERRVTNLRAILEKAASRLKKEVESNVSVPPRVLQHVINDGSFCEDDLLQEYYAGILVSSRTENASDDVNISLLSTLSELSIYQIRLHYVFYRECHRFYEGKDFDLNEINDCCSASVGLAIDCLHSIFGYTDTDRILLHSAHGLVNRGLVLDQETRGLNKLKGDHPDYIDEREEGIVLRPTWAGAELFLAANGIRSTDASMFFYADISRASIILPYAHERNWR